jgi:ketosteroid isomerase-like protein
VSRAEELVRGVYERWAQGDFTASIELFDRHTVVVINPGFPETGAYVGPKVIEGYTRELLGAWERLTITAEEIIPAGDSVVAAVVWRGAGTGSGAETELHQFQLWTFRGDTLVRLENFRERADALAAVGLSETA